MTQIYECEFCGKIIKPGKNIKSLVCSIGINTRSKQDFHNGGAALWEMCRDCHDELFDYLLKFKKEEREKEENE